MRKYQRGVTALGWLFLLTPLAIVAYAGVRLTPIYLNYLSVQRAIKQVAEDVPADSADLTAIQASLYKHFDINAITFPDVKDLKVKRANGTWTIQAAYDDQAPLFANLFILVSFDKTVTLKGGAGNGT